MLLKGGPGAGKSTLTQYVCAFHAARLVDEQYASKLLSHAESDIDPSTPLRIPFRIELRRYSAYKSDAPESRSFATYIAEEVSRASSHCQFSPQDVLDIAHTSPTLFVLDGFDEVPKETSRQWIIDDIHAINDHLTAAGSNFCILLSTRPQGYRSEFSAFRPAEVTIAPLAPHRFSTYAEKWSSLHIENIDDREELLHRVGDALGSGAFQSLSSTLLQAAVAMHLMRKGAPLPNARHILFSQYVDVIFSREEARRTLQTEPAALRALHEAAGFRILAKLETGDSRGLSAGDFRELVREAIDKYSSNPPPSVESFAALIDAVSEEAKNRLCFLAGQGDEQSEFDFSIQPFREFFAACYLGRQLHLDPADTLRALLDRPTVYENTAVFFAAMQTNNFHFRFFGELAEPVTGTALEKAKKYRARRILSRALSELEAPQLQLLKLATDGVFHPESLSQWDEIEEVSDIILGRNNRRLAGHVSDRLLQQAELSSNTIAILAILANGDSARIDLLAAEVDRRWGPNGRGTLVQVCIMLNIPLPSDTSADHFHGTDEYLFPFSIAYREEEEKSGVFSQFPLRPLIRDVFFSRRRVTDLAMMRTPVCSAHKALRLVQSALHSPLLDIGELREPAKQMIAELRAEGLDVEHEAADHESRWFATILRAIAEYPNHKEMLDARGIETQYLADGSEPVRTDRILCVEDNLESHSSAEWEQARSAVLELMEGDSGTVRLSLSGDVGTLASALSPGFWGRLEATSPFRMDRHLAEICRALTRLEPFPRSVFPTMYMEVGEPVMCARILDDLVHQYPDQSVASTNSIAEATLEVNPQTHLSPTDLASWQDPTKLPPMWRAIVVLSLLRERQTKLSDVLHFWPDSVFRIGSGFFAEGDADHLEERISELLTSSEPSALNLAMALSHQVQKRGLRQNLWRDIARSAVRGLRFKYRDSGSERRALLRTLSMLPAVEEEFVCGDGQAGTLALDLYGEFPWLVGGRLRLFISTSSKPALQELFPLLLALVGDERVMQDKPRFWKAMMDALLHCEERTIETLDSCLQPA